MKYFPIAFLAAFCAFLSANAQSNFKPGYIVTLKGDTTRGFIDYFAQVLHIIVTKGRI